MTTTEREISGREQLLRRYFRKIPVRPTHQEAKRWMIAGGAVFALGVLAILVASDGCSRSVLGIAFLSGAVALEWRGLSQFLREKYAFEKALVSIFPQPSDSEVDRWFANALDRVEQRSLEKLDLVKGNLERDMKRAPIIGPVPWYISGVSPDSVVWKLGEDGKSRFGVYEISFFWLAKTQLGIFRCDFDFIRDAILNEETYEFFYRDIISVSTYEKASSLTLASGTSLTLKRELRISVANDRYFSMRLRAEELKQLTGGESAELSEPEFAVNALRAKLRETKGLLPN